MPSSVIAAYSYDVNSRVLRITYISGIVYEYKNIPESVYIEMKATTAKGVFLNKHIKGKYLFEKIKGTDTKDL